jgi:hypothetical protein
MSGPSTESLTLEDVLFVSNGLVPICEHKGLRFAVPFRMFEPGTTIRRPGERGTLVLARAVAEWWELVSARAPSRTPAPETTQFGHQRPRFGATG